MADQTILLPLLIQDNTGKRRHTSMPRAGLVPGAILFGWCRVCYATLLCLHSLQNVIWTAFTQRLELILLLQRLDWRCLYKSVTFIVSIEGGKIYLNLQQIWWSVKHVGKCRAFTDKVERNCHFPAPGRNCYKRDKGDFIDSDKRYLTRIWKTL
jgi:hypothetical protein